MKFILSVIFSLIIFFSLLATLSFTVDAEEKIKIGVSTALSGDAATYGEDIRNFLLFANNEIAGGKYEFIFEDDKCSGKDAVSVAHKLISVDQVKYVTGFACSGALLSAAKLYEKAGVVTVSSFTSAPAISSAGDYIFRTWPSDVQPARLLTRHMAGKHKVIGLISEQTDYAEGFGKAVEEYAGRINLKVCREDFLSSDIDFKTQLLRLRQKGIEGLFVNSQTERTFLLVLKQVKEMKLEEPLYGAYWPESPAFLKEAGKLAEGIEYVSSVPLAEVLTAEGQKLLERFKQQYGQIKSIKMGFATIFEAFSALDQAIRSGQEPKEYLYRTKFSGILGDWHFDQNGDIVGMKYMIGKIVKGKPIALRREE